MTGKTYRLSPGVVVTDTNVLINFLRIEQLGLLGRLPELRFEVPQQVIDEVTWEAQAAALAAALEASELHPCEAPDVETSALYGSLLKRIESGEAACMRLHTCAASPWRPTRRGTQSASPTSFWDDIDSFGPRS